MFDAPRRKLQPMPDLPEAELSPDLDWLLCNPQFSNAQVAEAVVDECYVSLFRFAWAVLEDRQAAENAVEWTILNVLSKRERLNGEHSVKVELYTALNRICRRMLMKRKLRKILTISGQNSGQGEPNRDIKGDRLGGKAIRSCLESLDEEELIPLLLRELHGFSIAEIASVLQIKETKVTRCLDQVDLYLSGCIENETSTDRPLWDQISAELGSLWPIDEISGAELVHKSNLIESKLVRRGTRKRVMIYSQHLALATLVTLLVVGIGWIANRLAPSNPEPPPIETVIVTQIVEVIPPTRRVPTPEPIKTPVPLSPAASEAAVRQRMLESNRYWDNLWVDGLIIQYGPKGYVGAPLIRHEQIWISQPLYSLVLSAWANRDVDHVWFAANGKVYDVDLSTGRPRLYDYHNERLPVYSSLESFIFPAQIAKEAYKLEVTGRDKVAGRDTLILDWYSEDEVRMSQLWVDTQSGVVLRWRQYQNGSDILTLDIELTSIIFDAEFPRDTFDRSKLSIDFAGEDLDDPKARRATLTRSLVDTPPGHRPLDKVLPPEDFDLSQSRLVFQWNRPPRSGYIQPFLDDNRSPDDYGQEIPVDVFADGYYLGQVHLNPWSVVCDRSADGQSIAFISKSGERNEGVASLRWLNLMDLSTISEPLAEVQPGWDVAFAPDNSRLAYQGCIGEQCGVYVLDTQTGESERVSLQPGGYLTWNPDGDQLAWIGYLPSHKSPGVFVRDMDSGEVSYYGEVNVQTGDLPKGSPFTSWGEIIPDRVYGMDGCIRPRSTADPLKADMTTNSF
jgi:DNA-directed RNA polymerase specialized sigma24 family protein